MCGIVGVLSGQARLPDLEGLIRSMSQELAHRGPDAQGHWVDATATVGLGHRRLSILDLSAEGSQPMHSSSGRYVVVYNGEVYNYRELRKKLLPLGHSFRGNSDTEIILAAIEQWGVEAAVNMFIGMFSIALWDNENRTLFLIRDRLGIKPVYYGDVDGNFVFGSELKSIKKVPGFSGEINRDALNALLRFCFIPSPYTIYSQLKKLPPGSILTYSEGKDRQGDIHIKSYWSPESVVERANENPFTGTPEQAVDELDRLLKDAVRLRMLSDVPLGAFLSGGIDSSTVVAMMQHQSDRPVKTFTIGFKEQSYNEANHAKAVAEHLGTDHTELYVTPTEAMSAIPKMATLYDEPFADSSQIPTFLVSELTKRDVTVSLSGDGGDELFYGYRRYFDAQKRWEQIGWLPKSLRKTVGKILSSSMPQKWTKPHTLAALLGANNADDMYKWLLSNWKDPASVVIGSTEPETIFEQMQNKTRVGSFAQRTMFYDMALYLPDDILVKMDRASMGVSLEARVPILDHRVVEFAWRLPMDFKYRDGKGKWILRQVLNKYVPSSLIDRPKAGFGIPIDIWLRGPLRDWAEALLDEQRLTQQGFFSPLEIRKKWNEHVNGVRDWHYELWNVLMFQAWLEKH